MATELEKKLQRRRTFIPDQDGDETADVPEQPVSASQSPTPASTRVTRQESSDVRRNTNVRDAQLAAKLERFRRKADNEVSVADAEQDVKVEPDAMQRLRDELRTAQLEHEHTKRELQLVNGRLREEETKSRGLYDSLNDAQVELAEARNDAQTEQNMFLDSIRQVQELNSRCTELELRLVEVGQESKPDGTKRCDSVKSITSENLRGGVVEGAISRMEETLVEMQAWSSQLEAQHRQRQELLDQLRTDPI